MYQSSSPYSYESNPGYSFLQENMQQQIGSSQNAAIGAQFNQVLGSMSNGIQQGAQQGRIPFFAGNPQYDVNAARAQRLGVQTFGGLTAAQIAQQMSVGGAASVLPYIGGNIAPNVVFPIAGLWTLYDGVKSIKSVRAQAQAEVGHFDPARDLSYNRALQEVYRANEFNSNLGPLQ